MLYRMVWHPINIPFPLVGQAIIPLYRVSETRLRYTSPESDGR